MDGGRPSRQWEWSRMLDRDLEAFLGAEFPRLVRLLVLHLGDIEAARDVAQEALARAWLHRRQLQRADNPPAWVTRIALNLCRSQLRRRRLERLYLGRLVEAQSPADLDVALDLRRELALLPTKQRAAVILKYLYGWSGREIADTLECSESGARRLVANGLRKLRTQSEQHDSFGKEAGWRGI